MSRLVAFVSSFAISLTSGLSMGWNRKNYELDKNVGTALKKEEAGQVFPAGQSIMKKSLVGISSLHDLVYPVNVRKVC